MKRYTLYILGLLLYGCANPVSPTGGEKDIKAPVILSVDSTSKKGVVSIYFDENIKFQNNIQLNPTKESKKAKVEVENKSIHILIENYTKSISLNDAVNDLNENNAGKYPFILLGSDTNRLTVQYQNSQSSKTKVNGYIEKDSLKYIADNSKKDELRFEGLPSGNHIIRVYSDENKNNLYEENESYSILYQKNTDSMFTYLYPPKKETIFILQKDTEQYSYLVTNSFKIRESILNISQSRSHLDTVIYLTKDSSRIKEIVNNQIIKKLSIKKLANKKSTSYIYIDGKDTIYKTEYPVFYNGAVKHEDLKYLSKTNQDKFLQLRDTSEKGYRKLGKLIFQNDSNISYRLIIYKGKVELNNTEIIKGNTEFILPVGAYNYLLWKDEDKNQVCNPQEEIINYYFGVDINAQLSNIIIVKKSKNQEKNSANSKTILSDQ